jgi:hypothetical protein
MDGLMVPMNIKIEAAIGRSELPDARCTIAAAK